MDVTIFDLWLPVLLSAVFVFIASSILHMVIPIHKNDYKKLDKEDDVLAAMRAGGVKPGAYMFPCPSSMKDMGSPEMIAKFNEGPVGWMTVLPNGPWNMGKSLGIWFVFSVFVSVVAGYVASIGLGMDASGIEVFRVVIMVALASYAFTNITDSIWKGQAWSTTMKFIFDGAIYGAVTAATFAWLWPGPPAA